MTVRSPWIPLLLVGLMAGALAGQDGAPENPPPPVRIRPGELNDAERAKRQAELSGRTLRERKDPRALALQAGRQRRDWLDRLEREFGIYDVATLVRAGDVSKRVDVAIVSVGFPKSEAQKVGAMAESLKASLLKANPFRNYPAYINVYRVNVDDPGFAGARLPITTRDDHIYCEDHGKACAYARQAPDADLVVLLCNAQNVLATASVSGNLPGVVTIDASLEMGRPFLHEMGHAFAHLEDEYVKDGKEPPPDDEESEWATNYSRVGDPRLVKWHYWIPDVWKAAHQDNRLPKGRKVGCFEGAALVARGVWRPEAECLMRHGSEYCVVCFEQVEKTFYRLIEPIEDARPRRTELGLWADESVTLEADAIGTYGGKEQFGKFAGFWYVDGRHRPATRSKNLTTSLTLSAKELGPGVHEVGLRVDFSNNRVRRDHGWLSSSRAWTIDVSARPKPDVKVPAPPQGRVGTPVEFEVSVDAPDPSAFRLEAGDLPPGARFEKGRFAWTPEKAHQGAWRPVFRLTDGARSVDKTVEIAVGDPAEQKNYAPVFPVLEPWSIGEGEALRIPLDVVDVDGDNLVFASSALPDGMQVGVYDGVLAWTPGALQAGRYDKILIEVSDGQHRVKGSLDLMVEDRPPAAEPRERRRKDRPDGGNPGAVPELLHALRSHSEERRKAGLGRLESAPKILRFLEAARLLRDRSAEVRGAALAVLQAADASADKTFRTAMVKDLAPHAWHFTDAPEALGWLGALAAAKEQSDTPDLKLLRSSLKEIERYNKERGVGR